MVLALGAAPGLWESEALLVNGAPAPTPTRCEIAYAVLLQGLGSVAAVYFCRSRPALTIVDFEVMPLAPTAFTGVGSRLIDLGKAMRAEHGPFLFTNRALAEELLRLGHRAVVIDALAAEEAAMLATSAAVHVGNGRVKLAAAAVARAAHVPFGILAGTAGDDDDALRLAALIEYRRRARRTSGRRVTIAAGAPLGSIGAEDGGESAWEAGFRQSVGGVCVLACDSDADRRILTGVEAKA